MLPRLHRKREEVSVTLIDACSSPACIMYRICSLDGLVPKLRICILLHLMEVVCVSTVILALNRTRACLNTSHLVNITAWHQGTLCCFYYGVQVWTLCRGCCGVSSNQIVGYWSITAIALHRLYGNISSTLQAICKHFCLLMDQNVCI